jgi:hypothetical protein
MTNKKAMEVLKSECYVLPFLDGDRAALINTALDVAIEALKSRWIPVSDRVPEDDRLVIVCTESGQVYTDYYFDDKPDFWRLAKIIAWQDLPSAYKKEDSE